MHSVMTAGRLQYARAGVRQRMTDLNAPHESLPGDLLHTESFEFESPWNGGSSRVELSPLQTAERLNDRES